MVLFHVVLVFKDCPWLYIFGCLCIFFCFSTVVWVFKMFWNECGLRFIFLFFIKLWPISLHLDVGLSGKHYENYRLRFESRKCHGFDYNCLLIDHFLRIRFLSFIFWWILLFQKSMNMVRFWNLNSNIERYKFVEFDCRI